MADALPIDKQRGEFEESLRADRPTIVVAPTGSGKSTRLPLWMAESLDGPILVVEPRRVACRSLAQYLAKGRGEEAGQSIGYRVRFDDRTSDETEVIFATTGVALRMLGGADGGDDWPFAGVLVDEFHERGWEVDLIVATLRAHQDDPAFGPFVLTSATIEAERLAEELNADLVRSEGRTYPVDISYAGEPKAPTSRGLEGRVKDAVQEVCESPDDDGGDILVFLPGKGEISDCKGALGGVANTHNLDLVEVHGRLPPHKMAKAFDDQDKRRVFLATNVAETSVTLPGVTTVIDSGLVKQMIHRGGASALALVPTSEASMDQRAGRAGRVQPGRCVRLWSERFRPKPSTPPEIERIELDEPVLQAAMCGLDGERFDRAGWLTEPPEFAVENARQRLRDIGALDEDNELTDKGERLGELPVDAHDARMLIGVTDEMAGPMCDLVALLQRSTNLILPMGAIRGDTHRVQQNRNDLFKGCDDEVTAQLTALREGRPREHGLHRSAWEEAKKISSSLRSMVDAPAPDPLSDDRPLPKPGRMAEYLLDRIPESAFVLRERAMGYRDDGQASFGRSEPWGNGDIEVSVYPFESPVQERERDEKLTHPTAGLILSLFWTGDGSKGVHGIGSMLLPADESQLADAGLGEPEISRPKPKGHADAPRVVATVSRTYAGRTLRTTNRELDGRPLCEAVAELTFEGRMFRDAGDRIRDDLHLWDVLARWPAERRWWGEVEPPTEPEEWLTEHLWELGLRSNDDLMLLEPDDLRPDLADHFGMNDHQLAEWREKFPRLWSHMGRTYRCKVQPSTQKVILEPADKAARKGDDPQAMHVPRFEGFSVYYRNASRVVPVT